MSEERGNVFDGPSGISIILSIDIKLLLFWENLFSIRWPITYPNLWLKNSFVESTFSAGNYTILVSSSISRRDM